jgi:hypothetical protein
MPRIGHIRTTVTVQLLHGTGRPEFLGVLHWRGKMAQMIFKVLTVDPAIKTRVKKVPLYDYGVFAGSRDEETKYQTGTATDGSKYGGRALEYAFECEPGYVDVGDRISADTTQGFAIENVFVEQGRNASAPQPLQITPVESFDPNGGGGDTPFVAPDGTPFSELDIQQLLRSHVRLIANLMGRVRQLEANQGIAGK